MKGRMNEIVSHVIRWMILAGTLFVAVGICLSWLYLCTRVVKYAWGV
jgi:hypothetical protein